MGELITVTTTGGPYRGIAVRGVTTFLGIRYGEAPIGERRFLPARKVAAHSDVIDALAFGSVALQLDGRRGQSDRANEVYSLYSLPSGSATGGIPTNEDCLVLNVWAPNTVREPLPVMVWIHGGAFRTGSGSTPASDGSALARTSRAVVVTLNHRLGIPGFLSLGHLLGDQYAESGSAGLSDIALALEWVRDNIAAFGGDPDNVTLFGASGGGAKILALLRSPRARDLFHRCIVQSAGGDILTPEEGIEQTDRVLRALSIEPRDAATILTVSPGALIEAQALVDSPGHGPCPVEDGTFLLGSEAAHGTPHPLLVGSTTHEYSLFVAGEPWYAGLSHEDLPAVLEAFLPGEGVSESARYRRLWPGESPRLLLARILSDRSFGLVAAEIAAERSTTTSAPVYRYEFAYRTDALDGMLGAPHCLEVPFVFGSSIPLAGDGPERARLVREVMDCWLSFAESGVPQAPGGLAWPTVTAEPTASTMVIDRLWRVSRGLQATPVANRLL